MASFQPKHAHGHLAREYCSSCWIYKALYPSPTLYPYSSYYRTPRSILSIIYTTGILLRYTTYQPLHHTHLHTTYILLICAVLPVPPPVAVSPSSSHPRPPNPTSTPTPSSSTTTTITPPPKKPQKPHSGPTRTTAAPSMYSGGRRRLICGLSMHTHLPPPHFHRAIHTVETDKYVLTMMIGNTAISHHHQHIPLRRFTSSGYGRGLGRARRRWSANCPSVWIWGFRNGGLWGGRLLLSQMGGWEWGLLGMTSLITYSWCMEYCILL